MSDSQEPASGVRWTGGGRAPADRAARSDRVRRDNLSAVLELAHSRGALSRAQLTRETGLNRSTVAALVGELVERGLVVEGEPEASREVGRPSPIVRPDPSIVALAVNPEIDAVTVGAVGLGGQVLAVRRIDLDRSPTPVEAVEAAAQGIADVSVRVAELRGSGPDGEVRIVGVGIAVPGLVETRHGIVRLAPHLGWVDEPFTELLARRTGLSTHAANDASLGANAERIFGAGRGVEHLVYLNGGASGIGGGVIAGGRPFRGRSGFAGEIGHTFVSGADRADPSGSRGSLEVEVNRAALLSALGSGAVDADALDAALVGSTSPDVQAVIRRQLDHLSTAVSTVVNLFNPQMVVLGGFLASLDRAQPGRLETLVRERALPVSSEGLSIQRAQLGSSILMIGAAELAFSELLADPTHLPLRP
ncbi:ROK family transcriptional regulator [Naasia lichenicola]|uniref:ROK family transcriptional regulator n=1 Tax=Naasia lichenicola TaxID=2565933 RepID=A0A4S4FL64_9MICO|nr:ROK family transcriptional regulator [Naasia lichenicola]THG31089.1 ROK family transcriptional regulator [Naasia lichenicola]